MIFMNTQVLVLQGPNLNLLGTREPNIYGVKKLEDIHREMTEYASELGMELHFLQSNHEGCLIDAIQQAIGKYQAIIINAGAFTHYSVAIRDAIAAVKIPAIEVHISNIYSREDFRSNSVISPVVAGQITGFGAESYLLALQAANYITKQRDDS